MLSGSEVIPDASLSRLHTSAIDREAEIRDLLVRARRESTVLESRLSRGLERQTAQIDRIDEASLVLRTHNFDAEQPDQIFLNMALDGRRYFFSVPRCEGEVPAGALRVGLPSLVFYAERRDRERLLPGRHPGVPRRVVLRGGAAPLEAEVADFCPDGLLVRVPDPEAAGLPDELQVAFVDGHPAGRELFGAVRHQTSDPARPGWRRIGLSTSAARSGPPLPVERRDSILPSRALDRARRRWQLASAGVRLVSQRSLARWTGRAPELPDVRIVEWRNDGGERLRGVLDACGEVRGAPLVLIPPAWAKTKETLLPLARTIVETFRRAGESVAVVRLDGIRRRGESHNDPECLTPGRECHHLTFSQGIRDIRAALDHFETSEAFRPSTVMLVTFSGAAIEARRALAAETRGRVGGWVSVVGAADLKSGLRTVSGGVDYIGGAERDVRFGIQRILGIEVDIDRVAADALEHRMAYLEDARCDLEKLDLPITWIQGRYDAWIDPERVQQMLACGDARRRRVIEVPTGHQLRSSREALETFQLVAQEIARIALDRDVTPVAPDLADVERRRQAERARLPKSKVDLRAFWRDYLLGRDHNLGMDLLTATQPYRELMEAQVRALELVPGQRVVDLGSGTGAFPSYLLARDEPAPALRIDQVDYVREALGRARERLAAMPGSGGLSLGFLAGNLDLSGSARVVPVADACYDRVIASLLLNYVKEPSALLAEMRRLLRPGGRIVLSTLRRDADISRIYRDVSSELHAGGALERLGRDAARHLDESLHEFLNEAARLLDLEEEGIFHFWDADELVAHLRAAGFTDIETSAVFGDPPQAIVATAFRP